MLTGKEFVAKIKKENQALFNASQINVKAYFDSKPAQEELVQHFIGRMVNERMNMVEISQMIANLPADTDPVELQLLTQQAHDEAVHFRMVKEVIEHIQGKEVDVDAAIAAEAAKPTAKGAGLLAKYEAENCIEDQFISNRYAKIARDEGFHANIGARKLAQLMDSESEQQRIGTLVEKMRRDLYEISCKNTVAAEDGRKLVAEAYGW